MNKTIKRIAIGICAALLFVSVGTATILFDKSLKTSAQSLTLETQLQEKYIVGDKITLPNATIGGVAAEKYLLLPDGTRANVEMYTLDKAGKYTVVYVAQVNGVAQEAEAVFYCHDSKIKLDSISASMTYEQDRAFPFYKADTIDKSGEGAQEQLTARLTEIEAAENLEVYAYGDNKAGDKYVIIYEDKEKLVYDSGLDVKFTSGAVLELGDVVDVTKFDKNTPIFQGYVDALVDGYPAFRNIVLRLTDAHDPDNYIELMSYRDDVTSYYRARVGDQPSAGLNNGIINYDTYGTWTANYYAYTTQALTPANFSAGEMHAQRSTDFYLDYATLCVYNKYGNLVADLASTDYFPTPFKGFTTGEVFVSLYTDGYEDVSGNIFITSLAGVSGEAIGEKELQDDVGPILDVQLGDYSAYDLPKAVVGKKYTLFSATAKDLLSGCKQVQTRVWYNYYSANPINVSVSDGGFIPQYEGDYVIEYSVSDYMDNRSVQVFPITAVKQIGSGMKIELISPQTAGFAGEQIPVADYEVQNASGATEVKITATCGNESLVIDNEALLLQAEIVGVWTVKYTVADFAGQTAEKSYDITVTADVNPIFKEEVVLPRYILEGFDNPLPALSAYDYQDNAKEVKTVVSVEAEGKERVTLDGYSFKPDASYVGKRLKFIYTATTATGASVKEYYADCVSVIMDGNVNKIDKKQLFVCSQGVTASYALLSSGTTNYATYTMNTNGSLSFVNRLSAHDFAFQFNVRKSGAEKITVYLTDSEDASKEVKICFLKERGNTSVVINDGLKYALTSNIFADGDVAMEVAFDNLNAKVLLDNKNFTYQVGETEFFSSRAIYFRIEAEDVTDETQITVQKVGNQTLTDSTRDNASPFGTINGEYRPLYKQNDVVKIIPYTAFDVINPNVQTSVSVTYNGKFVTDVKGRVVDNLSLDDEIEIALTEYGYYTVCYNILGYNSYEMGLNVDNFTPPTVTVTSALKNVYKVGDSIAVSATAKDNAGQEIKANVMIKNADGCYLYVKNGAGYTFSKAGNYTVFVFAYDEKGNYACIEQKLIVEGE